MHLRLTPNQFIKPFLMSKYKRGGGGVIHINNMCSKVTIVFEWVYIWGQEAGLIFEGLWYGKAMCKAPNEAISGFIVST